MKIPTLGKKNGWNQMLPLLHFILHHKDACAYLFFTNVEPQHWLVTFLLKMAAGIHVSFFDVN